MKERTIKLLTKVWHSRPINFIRKHAGKFLIGSLIFMGLIVWLGWKDTYKAPLWGEVQVYVKDSSFQEDLIYQVDKIEVYVNLGRTKITYSRNDPTAYNNFFKYTVWVDTEDIIGVRILGINDFYYGSWRRLYGN